MTTALNLVQYYKTVYYLLFFFIIYLRKFQKVRYQSLYRAFSLGSAIWQFGGTWFVRFACIQIKVRPHYGTKVVLLYNAFL